MKKRIAILAAVIAVLLLGGAVSYAAFVSELKHTGFPVGENAVCTIDGKTASVTGSGEIDFAGSFETFVYEKARGLNPYYALMNRFYSGGLPVETVTLGPEITGVYTHSFWDCSRLTEIAVDETNPYLCGVDGVLFNKDMTLLTQYPAGREDASYTVPEGVEEIGEDAFADAVRLREIALPDTLTKLGPWAFSGCTALETVLIPGGVKTVGAFAFSACSALREVTLSDGVKYIESQAFFDCPSLTSVTVPDSVVAVGEQAFGFYLDGKEDDRLLNGFTLRGGENSAAKRYAEKNGIGFEVNA